MLFYKKIHHKFLNYDFFNTLKMTHNYIIQIVIVIFFTTKLTKTIRFERDFNIPSN
jgi:hypothetical protein